MGQLTRTATMKEKEQVTLQGNIDTPLGWLGRGAKLSSIQIRLDDIRQSRLTHDIQHVDEPRMPSRTTLDSSCQRVKNPRAFADG